MKKEWAEEEKRLGNGDFNGCRYGGCLGTQAKATGFFRVGQIDGRWWFVDPDGHLFLSTTVNGMWSWSGTRTGGRESYYAALPPAELKSSNPRADQGSDVSFHTWNLLRRFGPDWPLKWVDLTLPRMNAWGLNTVGNWADPKLWAS